MNSLSFYFVKNIQIEKSVYLTLKNLSFEYSQIIDNNKEGKNNLLPELEDLYFGFNYIDLEKNLLNFQSLKQLKRFKGRNRYFLLIQSQLLEEIVLEDDIIKLEELKQTFNKIFPLKFIKKIDLKLRQKNNKVISEIFGKNESIKEIKIKFSNENEQRIFYHLQNSFLNLTNLNIEFNPLSLEEGLLKKYEFIESPISKVKNIQLIIYKHSSFKIFCQSFEKIESINFETWGLNENLINLFPLLSDKCQVIFKSLKSFGLIIRAVGLNSDVLQNIFNNIDNMPNLINFTFICKPKEMKRKFRQQFLNKILTMKYIKRIDIQISKNRNVYKKFSKDELMKIFPDVNFYKFYEVNIIDELYEVNQDEIENYYNDNKIKENQIKKNYKNEKKDKILIMEDKENRTCCPDFVSQILV